jgi:hypothetical protein
LNNFVRPKTGRISGKSAVANAFYSGRRSTMRIECNRIA